MNSARYFSVEESSKSPKALAHREVEVLEGQPTTSFLLLRLYAARSSSVLETHFTQGFHGARTNRVQIEYPSALKYLLFCTFTSAIYLKSIPHLLTTATPPTNRHPPVVPVGCAASPANAIRSSRVSLLSHATNSSGCATRSGTAASTAVTIGSQAAKCVRMWSIRE